MSGSSKVIVIDPDARAARQVQLGFEREGVPTQLAPIPLDTAKLELPCDDAGLVVIGGADGRALEVLKRARSVLEEGHSDAPIVFAGRGVRRTDAEAAGADEVVLQPAYLRDVVTIGRLLRGTPPNQRTHLVGNLVETTGVFTLIRALAALGRSATLTLIRGLRRGEVRFYHGEVTSAQVGLIHGQAALHQLLLWTDARFDFHHEDVVRRQQIPLAPEELWADAERFLEGVRDSSGGLSPAMVLEQDVQRVQNLGKQIPTEVHGVLRMFDGHRVLADVLEDSPYRVFETLRVAQRALDAGLLRTVEKQKPKTTWRAVLAIEEWLVGNESREDVIERTAAVDSGPIATQKYRSKKRRKKRTSKQRPQTPLPVPNKVDIDWGALVPRIVGAEVGPLSGVVPASQTAGEIEAPQQTRDLEREKLEALLDTDKRGKIFPTDIGLEPTVVFDDQAVTRPEPNNIVRSEPEPERPAWNADAGSVIRDALARQQRERNQTAGPARADEVRARAEEAEWTRREAEAKATGTEPPPAAETPAETPAEAAVRIAHEAEARAAAGHRARARADAEARARAEAEAAREAEERAYEEREAAEERAAAERAATAAAERAAAERAAAEAEAAERAAAERATAERDAETAASERAAAERAAAERAAAERAAAETAAAERAAAETAAERPAAERAAAEPSAAERVAAEHAATGASAERVAAAETTAAERVAAAATDGGPLATEPVDTEPVAVAGESAVAADVERSESARARAERVAVELAAAERVAAQAEARARAEREEAAEWDAAGEAAREAERRADDEAWARAAANAVRRTEPPGLQEPDKTPAASTRELVRDLREPSILVGDPAVGVAAPPTTAAAPPSVAAADTAAPARAPSTDTAKLTASPIASVEASTNGTAAAPLADAAADDATPTASTTARSGAPPAELFTATPIASPDSAGARSIPGASAESIASPDSAGARSIEPRKVISGELEATQHVPAEVIDAPSDGVVVQHIATVETAPVGRRPPSVPPVDDRPEDMTGEITMPRALAVPEPVAAEPSILVADLAAEVIDPAPPPAVEPLVADLAAAHVAVSAVATAQAAAPQSANAAAAPQSADVATARKDVETFSAMEEAFFRAGHEKTTKPPAPVESFEDLDEDYEPQGFWDRVRGKKPTKPKKR